MSPAIKTVGFSLATAAPIAVEVLPSIPLVPRLQKTSIEESISINCAYRMAELLLTCNMEFFGKEVIIFSKALKSEKGILAKYS